MPEKLTPAGLQEQIATMELPKLLERWRNVEPARFPYRFGGMGWSEPGKNLERAGFVELGVAVDAANERGWPIELRSVVTANAVTRYEASVTYAPLGVAALTHDNPIDALLRAVVLASCLQVGRPATRSANISAIAVTSFPLTESGVPPTTTPAEDLRVWSRIEPEWFGGKSGHYASPTYQGTSCYVLAPVHRGLVALQYMPTLTVSEAASSRNWGFRVRSEVLANGGARYECEITLKGGSVARAYYPTIAPACVKAYLTALVIASGGGLNIVPAPTDRFFYKVVAIECQPGCRLRTPHRDDQEWAEFTGTFAAREVDLERLVIDGDPGFTIVDHEPTSEEVDASVAGGLLPPPWP